MDSDASGAAHRKAARRRIEQIEVELAALEAIREKLEDESSDLYLIHLFQYKYPVLTLPDDIVSEIFLHCLPSYPDAPPLAGLGSPTNLLGICHLWRTIALSTPRLWRSIHWQHTPSDTQEYCEWALRTVQLWLDRSGSIALSIFLDFNVPQLPKGGDELVQALVVHRSRWEYANLCFLPGQASVISGSAPQLAELVVTTGRWEILPSNNVDRTTERISFPDALRLHSFCAQDATHADVRALPCTNLTSLFLWNTNMGECLPIMRAATNLRRCNLYLVLQIDGDPDDLESRSSITLPRLEELALCICEARRNPQVEHLPAGQRTELFLDSTTWTLPGLKRVHVGDVLFSPILRTLAPKLIAFITRFEGQLERIRLDDMRGQDAQGTLSAVNLNELQEIYPGVAVEFCVPREHDVELWVKDLYFT